MKTSYTEVSVKLQDIIVTDLNIATIHPKVPYLPYNYKKIYKLNYFNFNLL